MLSKTRSGKLYKIDYPKLDDGSRKSALAIKSFHNKDEEISQFCYDSEESLSMENDKSVNDDLIILNNNDSISFNYDDIDIINTEFDHNADQIQSKANNSSVLTIEQIARIKHNREVALIKLSENQSKYTTPQLLIDHKKPLSDEQRERIEQNRKQALQKRNSLSIKSNIIHNSSSKVIHDEQKAKIEYNRQQALKKLRRMKNA